MKHVVWDWNGTLLDDLDLLVEATSSAMTALGQAPVDVDIYRTHHQRPLTRFYSSMLGREVTEEEFSVAGDAFYSTYMDILPRAQLASDALMALAQVRRRGCSQSILSMWIHENLGPLIDKFELSPFFCRIDGLETRDQGTKAECLERHIAKLEANLGQSLDRTDITIVGDTMDDGNAASDAGINCVFVATGAQHLSDLKALEWPVAPSLLTAVDLIFASQMNNGS